MHNRLKTAYCTLSFLNFSGSNKAILPLCWHFWCSKKNRRQQGLFRNISLLYLVETRLNPTVIRIKRQERNCFRQLKVWKMRFTSCNPALDMLTLPLVSLSKPVGPSEIDTVLCQNEFHWRIRGGLLSTIINSFFFLIKEL